LNKFESNDFLELKLSFLFQFKNGMINR